MVESVPERREVLVAVRQGRDPASGVCRLIDQVSEDLGSSHTICGGTVVDEVVRLSSELFLVE